MRRRRRTGRPIAPPHRRTGEGEAQGEGGRTSRIAGQIGRDWARLGEIGRDWMNLLGRQTRVLDAARTDGARCGAEGRTRSDE